MRSLRAGEGEVRPGEVVSTRSGCGMLADAGMGPLIKPVGIRLVQEMSPGRILIGCWAGRLWKLGKLGILHWGTHPSPGWRASYKKHSYHPTEDSRSQDTTYSPHPLQMVTEDSQF